jgi:hypothetical protein
MVLTDTNIETNDGWSVGTEDILAIGAVVVAIIIAVGIVFKTVDVVQGGAIITALVGVAGIAQVIKARRGDSGGQEKASDTPKDRVPA